ncbi:hypothetical protein C2845_PM01G22020 [Panicum miliaceum]|uniref:F-box associated domain-containing protein n=1 Tax=Panicum miliaceum TaxID=4540 RepID=A0A3L6TIF6_PANMI|nr:hypothetical protein C2845_PM01G22020 [Panicum miliaceum]
MPCHGAGAHPCRVALSAFLMPGCRAGVLRLRRRGGLNAPRAWRRERVLNDRVRVPLRPYSSALRACVGFQKSCWSMHSVAPGSSHDSEGMKDVDGRISGESLYMDGTIYLLHLDKLILAFDVDDETVAAIDLPGERESWRRLAVSPLMAVSGRPCVDTQDRRGRSLWLLTAEHQWQRIYDHRRSTRVERYSIAGVWDCGGGILAMYLRMSGREDGLDEKLFLYCTETKKLRELNLPRSLTPEWPSDYALCWGYKPTLVSPGSIVGELNQEEERRRHRTADIMAALKPVNERDRRKGHKETLDTVLHGVLGSHHAEAA